MGGSILQEGCGCGVWIGGRHALHSRSDVAIDLDKAPEIEEARWILNLYSSTPISSMAHLLRPMLSSPKLVRLGPSRTCLKGWVGEWVGVAVGGGRGRVIGWVCGWWVGG